MKTTTQSSPLACRINERGWKIEARVRAIAGALVLVSAVLAVLVSPLWLLLAAFVGVNLMQSGLTNYCLMSNLLSSVFPSLAEKS